MDKLINKFFAILLILILFPLYLVIYIYLLIVIGKPVLFKQLRSGLNGKNFNLYKFRTMKINKELNITDSKRIIRSAIFLRHSRLDELPQLFNILKGDINFVGPRPLLPEYDGLYNSEQKKRLNVMPGITGWAQINGDNNISWSKKFELDIWYVQNKSLLLDLKIIFLTIIFILKKIIGNKNKKLIMEKFNGRN